MVSGRKLDGNGAYCWNRLVVASSSLGDLVVEQGDTEAEVGEGGQRKHQRECEAKEW